MTSTQENDTFFSIIPDQRCGGVDTEKLPSKSSRYKLVDRIRDHRAFRNLQNIFKIEALQFFCHLLLLLLCCRYVHWDPCLPYSYYVIVVMIFMHQ